MKAEYIDHMGDDLRVVNAARVSFDKESDWVHCLKGGECTCTGPDHGEWLFCDHSGGPGILSERDKKLIRYLAKHNHWTPFSHVTITMRETIPIFLARQRFKHMVGFTYNEVSRRYVDSEPEFYHPPIWRKRAENKKQGSSTEKVYGYQVEENGVLVFSNAHVEHQELCEHALKVYREMLAAGVCPEQARMVLPQSMLTSYYVTGSLAAWARAYKQRNDPEHAQREWLPLCEQWDSIIRPLFPESWEALTNA